MKILRSIIKFIGWLIIILSGLMMPILLYQLHAVFWGGAVEGDLIYLDSFAPSRIQAIIELAVIVTIFVFGLILEHYGTKTMDRIINSKREG